MSAARELFPGHGNRVPGSPGNGFQAAGTIPRQVFPSKPVVVLSDLLWMPEDIAPYASGFVRKGEPEQLLTLIESLLRTGKA